MNPFKHILPGRASRKDIAQLLAISNPVKTEQLFQAARDARNAAFGDSIFLYGFVYFSTFCRNNCRFCQYRYANRQLTRYRKSEEQILSAAMELADTGVHLIDLTMGEDPELFSTDRPIRGKLARIVKTVHEKTGLPVMISPGVVPDDSLETLVDNGACWFACYQETHNRTLYKTLRPGQDFEQRIEKKLQAKKHGMLIEEGVLINVGESLDDLADSIIWMRDNHVDQARAMTFVPQDNTPLSHKTTKGNLQELITIAVMRLILPDRLIPASLDVDGLDGLTARLDAGANVVTSIVPPEKGLAGVAHKSLDIDDARRSTDHILPILESCKLRPASREQYADWIKTRQQSEINRIATQEANTRC